MTHDPDSVDAVLAEVARNDGFSGKGRAAKCAMVLRDEVLRLRELAITELDRLKQVTADVKQQCARLEANYVRDMDAANLLEVIQANHLAWHAVRIHAQAIESGEGTSLAQQGQMPRLICLRADAIVDLADAALKLAYDVGVVELIGPEELIEEPAKDGDHGTD